MGTNNSDLLTLEFYLLFEKVNLASNFWTVSARVYSFHMNICSDKTFPWVPIFLTVTSTLEFDLYFDNFNLANNFWIVSARLFIFHMSIPYDGTIIFYPVTLTLEFDPFFENFNLANIYL